MSDTVEQRQQGPEAQRWTSGMAWAVRQGSREPVYIGQLVRADKGLACACICPACDAPLQAVAPGLQETSTRVPFFRHHQAQQGPGCKHRVAELTALRLFAEKGIIEIPAPTGSGAVIGHSGKLYEKARVGEVIREEVVGRRAISDIEVELTLKSGRTVIFTLRGEQHLGELGSAHAVIQIHVTDPEVAMMSEAQILEHARITPRFLRLIAHADKSGLDALAADDARMEALERLDISPDDIHLPEGATAKQASESLLHWVVKDSLATLGRLRTPVFRHLASVMTSDGKPYASEVTLPELTLELSDVAWEVHHDGFRPDIVCWAVDTQGGLGRFRLLIEVAKSNTVSATKLARIRAAGLACLQIDVYKFGRSGQVTRSELGPLVATDLSSKEWLCHPVLDRLIADAEAKVSGYKARHELTIEETAKRLAAQRAREASEKERLQREAVRRTSWAGQLTQREALRELRAVLERRWSNELEITSNGMHWESGEFEKRIQHLWPAYQVPRSLTDRGGLAWRISRILAVSYGSVDQLDFKSTLGDGSELPWTRTQDSWLGLLHAIIEFLNVSPFPLQYEAYAAHRNRVKASLLAGNATFARDTGDDAFLAEMFPEIAPVLNQAVGTVGYAEVLKKRFLEERDARLAEENAFNQAEQQRRQAELAVAATRKATEQASFSMVWNPIAGAPATPERVLLCLRATGTGELDARWKEMVFSALRAKLAGEPLAAWINRQVFESAGDVDRTMHLLRNAYLAKGK